jgi:hypothetical protein
MSLRTSQLVGPGLTPGPASGRGPALASAAPLPTYNPAEYWDRSPLGIPAPVPGTRTLAGPLALFVALDDSSSNDGSDPLGLRLIETHHTIARLAGDPDAHEADTATVIAFAATTATLGPLRVRSARNRRRLTRFLQKPHRRLVPGTVFTNVVRAVQAAATTCPAGSARVLILVTDGAPYPPQEAAELPALLAALADTAVHLVALNGGGAYGAFAPSWEAAGPDSIHVVDNPRPGDLAHALVALTDTALGR